LVGEGTIEIVVGMGIVGTTKGFLINIFKKIGEPGALIDIGT
jgi:hypothetical protein